MGSRSEDKGMTRQTYSDTMKVSLLDLDDLVRISGEKRECVDLALSELARLGARITDAPHREGEKWTASCQREDLPTDDVQIERLGNRVFLRSRSFGCLHTKVSELAGIRGTILEGEIFRIGAFFTAVFYDSFGLIQA